MLLFRGRLGGHGGQLFRDLLPAPASVVLVLPASANGSRPTIRFQSEHLIHLGKNRLSNALAMELQSVHVAGRVRDSNTQHLLDHGSHSLFGQTH